jgi:5'-nucleotidase
MLQSLQAADVPVLVFSAGLGDSVSAVLRYHNALLSNVHIISNYLRFNGLQVNGFKGDVIHPFNKNEHAIEKSDYFQVSTADNFLHTSGTSVCNFLYRVFYNVL